MFMQVMGRISTKKSFASFVNYKFLPQQINEPSSLEIIMLYIHPATHNTLRVQRCCETQSFISFLRYPYYTGKEER